MNYYLFTIQYDGTDFFGWAKQKNRPTIQGELEYAIKRVTRGAFFHVVGASKTDAGVHADSQKAWVELEFSPNLSGFLKALNNALPLGIKIKKIEPIEADFRVRNCVRKTYEYKINLNETNVFENRFYYQAKFKINVKKLETALKIFEGLHDFRNFSGLKDWELKKINSKRSVDKIEVINNNGLIKITFFAKGFIRYQIRMIVGTALAYATNKISLEKIKVVLNLKEPKMPYMAKPQGLTLVAIDY